METTAAKRLIGSDHRPFRVGFVPLLDCAPLVVAQEMGMFAKQGVSVLLVRQPSYKACAVVVERV